MQNDDRFSWKSFPNARKTMYRELATKFGVIDTKEDAVKIRSTLGLHQHPSEYISDLNKALKLLHFGKSHKGTDGAVATQISWAASYTGMCTESNSPLKEGCIPGLVENMAAANAAGFISDKFMTTGRRINMNDGSTAILRMKKENGEYSYTLTKTVIVKEEKKVL
jgi:hypothetical protein